MNLLSYILVFTLLLLPSIAFAEIIPFEDIPEVKEQIAKFETLKVDVQPDQVTYNDIVERSLDPTISRQALLGKAEGYKRLAELKKRHFQTLTTTKDLPLITEKIEESLKLPPESTELCVFAEPLLRLQKEGLITLDLEERLEENEEVCLNLEREFKYDGENICIDFQVEVGLSTVDGNLGKLLPILEEPICEFNIDHLFDKSFEETGPETEEISSTIDEICIISNALSTLEKFGSLGLISPIEDGEKVCLVISEPVEIEGNNLCITDEEILIQKDDRTVGTFKRTSDEICILERSDLYEDDVPSIIEEKIRESKLDQILSAKSSTHKGKNTLSIDFTTEKIDPTTLTKLQAKALVIYTDLRREEKKDAAFSGSYTILPGKEEASYVLQIPLEDFKLPGLEDGSIPIFGINQRQPDTFDKGIFVHSLRIDIEKEEGEKALEDLQATQEYCNLCGDGAGNACDKNECAALGPCDYETKWYLLNTWGTCTPKEDPFDEAYLSEISSFFDALDLDEDLGDISTEEGPLEATPTPTAEEIPEAAEGPGTITTAETEEPGLLPLVPATAELPDSPDEIEEPEFLEQEEAISEDEFSKEPEELIIPEESDFSPIPENAQLICKNGVDCTISSEIISNLNGLTSYLEADERIFINDALRSLSRQREWFINWHVKDNRVIVCGPAAIRNTIYADIGTPSGTKGSPKRSEYYDKVDQYLEDNPSLKQAILSFDSYDHCPHVAGKALDITIEKLDGTKVSNARRRKIMCSAGWINYGKEPWHFEYETSRWDAERPDQLDPGEVGSGTQSDFNARCWYGSSFKS